MIFKFTLFFLVLDSAVPHISATIKPFWEKVIQDAVSSRDIRQYAILLEYIFDTSRLLQENASLANDFRIALVRIILHYGISWKAPELRKQIVDWIIHTPNVINNDYQMIRSSIGSLLFAAIVWKNKLFSKLIVMPPNRIDSDNRRHRLIRALSSLRIESIREIDDIE